MPPVRDRDSAAVQKIAVQGFRVTGVADHSNVGLTPANIQSLADAQYQALAAKAGSPVELSFDDMQGVANKIVERYRNAGFIVSNAFLPAQTVGADKIVEIRVLEGKIGKIIVKGNKRYQPDVISAAAQKLRGKPLLKSDVDSALLYARDLPGVTVASTFQPGEHTGDTDLVMIATEAKRPLKFTLGANNYGTPLTGRYRAQAGVEWANPLGIGDVFNLNVDYALVPSDNIYGAASYRVPATSIPGLTAVVGASRNELQINTGTFAALDVKGPSSMYYGGADWKFINRDDLQMVSTLHLIREESRLDSLGIHLSDEKFLLAELTYGLLHTDRRFNGVDILQVGVRKSINDDSLDPDLVSPLHAHSFLVGKLSYTRMQFLTKSQRLYLKIVGQYSNDALIPLEQFALGGPDSIRAYPIADALRDRGYYTSLEYHVDAPGFGDKVSPFYGRPWRELLEFQLFVDYAKGFSAGANRESESPTSTLSGVGGGLIFRLPRFHHFEFHLNGAVPLGSQDASDKKGYHIYSRFSFTF
ncbi:ShlB/FhaC/HecB family hemolysin secretion/activation protein [Rhodanobacter sp. AS-Z3]|uniref:ShlB/FhaC/HecB family hemolysin secretion/activation protein n=1 Tax=Rhodanobacter sp. AS-Z3 TaxID=3031330 RepID=UPI002479BC7F|nr:ShlB/FhaC/HecB family hemolysin secretion/activation protein [Rhodanobacter sp. AS-Z3]WEN14474.1 ShlB/FhaC/HecB family hemolysin secretion/activation protein [Rhodanobacter sp. AS-Z3]